MSNGTNPVPGAHGAADAPDAGHGRAGHPGVDQTHRKIRDDLGEGTGPATPAPTETQEASAEAVAE